MTRRRNRRTGLTGATSLTGLTAPVTNATSAPHATSATGEKVGVYRPGCGPEAVLTEPITCADEVYKIVKPIIGSAPVEIVILLCLDARGRLIGAPFEVTRGTLTVSVVHPREVFHEAIARRAAQIILAHNHPSGDVVPSDSDMELTQRLREGGEMLGIPLVDHLVVTDQTWRSLV